MSMSGIEFLFDRRGRRKAVLIDLTRYRAVWEDFYDAHLAHQRRQEPRESLAQVKKRIQRKFAR